MRFRSVFGRASVLSRPSGPNSRSGRRRAWRTIRSPGGCISERGRTGDGGSLCCSVSEAGSTVYDDDRRQKYDCSVATARATGDLNQWLFHQLRVHGVSTNRCNALRQSFQSGYRDLTAAVLGRPELARRGEHPRADGGGVGADRVMPVARRLVARATRRLRRSGHRTSGGGRDGTCAAGREMNSGSWSSDSSTTKLLRWSR